LDYKTFCLANLQNLYKSLEISFLMAKLKR